VDAVIVMGDSAYYARFGFPAELARRLEAPFEGDALTALGRVSGAPAAGGRLRCPEAFDCVC
jgi:predicted N-acetyltransferase YhbS